MESLLYQRDKHDAVVETMLMNQGNKLIAVTQHAGCDDT
jgi:hypothetical protein